MGKFQKVTYAEWGYDEVDNNVNNIAKKGQYINEAEDEVERE